MDFKEINKLILKSTLQDSDSFIDCYLQNEEQIINELKTTEKIKTEIYLKEVDNDLLDNIRFASIFSDVTIINTTYSEKNGAKIHMLRPESKYFINRQLTIPIQELYSFPVEYFDFFPCYISRLDDELKKVAKSFKPLIKSSKLMIRPLRSINAKNKLTGENIFHYVNPNTENNHWFIDNRRNDDSYFIMDNGISYSDSKLLFEVTLPYFKDIELDTLAKILEDENDLLSAFRNNLKKVIIEANRNFKSVNEIRSDLLNPEIEKLNRKFKVIKNAHKLTTIGLVGTFSLSFVLVYATHSDMMKLVVPGVGILATGMIASENYYNQKNDDLKDNNFYLLWKIKKRAPSREFRAHVIK